MIGTSLGPYRLLELLGEGGMGQVFRAMDTTLGRHVAVKILPEAVARDPDRLARFEREARTLASLNHPHIAVIHAIEQSGPVRAIVMELVEGEDLAQRIARGPVPIDEALALARQILAALEAAHEHGIVHRDLKPANIRVRPDGTVKVLDFGLAKALEPAAGAGLQAPGALTNSPTLTSPALLTGAGVILGTAAYMAPEQAKGRVVDARADIWAFGVVLFEMLTGRRPFAPADGAAPRDLPSREVADDVHEVLAAVLRDEPDWGRLPADVPPRVRKVVQACLRKNVRTGSVVAGCVP